MSPLARPIDEPAFEYVRKLVRDQAAIALEPNKQYLVESRLLPLARRHGWQSVRELVAQLRGRPISDLHAQVVEAMAISETSFFRDGHPFEALAEGVLPSLIAARQTTRTLAIWSAACSTGQEPYSIALLLAERFPQLASWKIQIHATDLSRSALDQAAAGEYTQLEVSRGLPEHLLAKYFAKSGARWSLRPEIRQRVQFTRANLIEPWPRLPPLDIVLLRNVLIYFTPEAKRDILARLKRRLAGDGVLLLGGAETTLGIDDDWRRDSHGKTSLYRLAPGRLNPATTSGASSQTL
jgi:chemotaxis protein methyltransferase CheR